MPDFVAWWGALTGSAAAAFTIRREIHSRRIRVRVDHGWRYVPSADHPPKFEDLMVYVMVTNTGGRNVPVQHVGWEWLSDTGERTPEGSRLLLACRAEVPLKEPVLLEPDGIPLKVEVWAGQFAHLLDPIETAARPVAFTGGGFVRWEGPWGPIAQGIPPDFDLDQMRHRFEELKAEAKPPRQMGRSPDLFCLAPGWLSEIEGSTWLMKSGSSVQQPAH